MGDQLYEVWLARGRGLELGPRFANLKDAVAWATDHKDEAACGIRRPTGDWYRWPQNGQVMWGAKRKKTGRPS